MKIIYKYATGAAVPDDAEYLATVVEQIGDARLVWHYAGEGI